MMTGRSGALVAALVASVCAVSAHSQEVNDPPPARILLEDEQSFDCRIVEMRENTLVFEADWLRGRAEAILGDVRRVVMTPRANERGADQLSMTNGDVLVGDIVAMDETTVDLKSKIMGEVAVPRALVARVVRTSGGNVLLSSDFSLGDLGSWRPVSGNWKVQNGLLGTSDEGMVSAKAEQQGSVTITAVLTSERRVNSASLHLYMDRPRTMGDAPLMVMLNYYEVSAYSRTSRGHQEVFERPIPDDMRRTREVTLHVTVDEDKKKVTAWLNEKQVGEGPLPIDQLEGNYIGLALDEQTQVRDIRVVKGVQPPATSEDIEAREDAEVLVLANGDRVSATETQIRDGVVVAVLPHGELEFPGEHVKSITFRTSGRHLPRRNNGDAHIYTRRSRLTLRPERIDNLHLVGKSDYLGEVKIDRRAIRQMEFDIYRALLEGAQSGRSKYGATPSDDPLWIQPGGGPLRPELLDDLADF